MQVSVQRENVVLHVRCLIFGTHTCQKYAFTGFSPLFLLTGGFAEAVCLSDPRVHQTLHRPQLVTEARQSPLSQRPSGEGGQGNDSKLDT